jgi:hypothetical protein
MNCNASTTFVLFRGLYKYRTYCARVLAVANSVKGNASDCINVTTDEDGALTLILTDYVIG